MLPVWVIARKEITGFWLVPAGFGIAAAFVFVCQFFFFGLLDNFNVLLQQRSVMSFGPAPEGLSLNELVVEGYLQMQLSLLIIFIPLLVMNSFAGERQRGTWDLLLSTPVTLAQIWLGKVCGAAANLLMLLFLAALFPLLLGMIGELEYGTLAAGLLGVWCCAVALLAPAMAIAAGVRSRGAGVVGGVAFLLVLCLIDLPLRHYDTDLSWFLTQVTPVGYAREFIRGVVSLRALVYFMTLAAAGCLAMHVLLTTDREGGR